MLIINPMKKKQKKRRKKRNYYSFFLPLIIGEFAAIMFTSLPHPICPPIQYLKKCTFFFFSILAITFLPFCTLSSLVHTNEL